MSAGSGGSRLMSIHSMLGGGPENVASTATASDNVLPIARRQLEESRPSSVPALQQIPQASSRQQERASQNQNQSSIFRASSQPPGSAGGPHEPPRFFAPAQTHEPAFGQPLPHQHQHSRQQAQSQGPLFNLQQGRPPSRSGTTPQSQPDSFSLHNAGSMSLPKLFAPTAHEREREREREREEERRQRDRERNESNRTPTNRFDMASRPTSHTHTHAVSHHHHHHHVHHNHPPFKRPKLTIISQKVFEETKLYPEKKLGRWTYNPTIRVPFTLSVNASFTVHVPRKYTELENNSALRRRKVWGTEIYTDDSDLAAILVHSCGKAAHLDDFEMKVRVMPRLLRYKSSMSNELRSRGWASKHDGLSLYVENVAPVSWQRQSAGKGFTKRVLNETHYLRTGCPMGEVIRLEWPPQKYRKYVSTDASLDDSALPKPDEMDVEAPSEPHVRSNEVQQDEPEGDETIELSIDEQEPEAETSFIEPRGPLITKLPDVLPTKLSSAAKSKPPHQELGASENVGPVDAEVGTESRKASPVPEISRDSQVDLDDETRSVTLLAPAQDNLVTKNIEETAKAIEQDSEPTEQ